MKILNVIRKDARSTVGQIAERAHLSRLTVAKILQRLGTEEIVREDGKAPGSAEGGRKPQLYYFNPKARYSLGILIGQKAISGRLVDLNIRTVEQLSHPVESEPRVDEVVDIIDEIVSTLLSKAGITRNVILGIGVGTHGVTDSKEGVVLTSPHNPKWGTHLNLREILRERLGSSIPIFIDNAIRFRTLAETTAGKLRSTGNAIVIHCADGLIAGNVLNGSIQRGVHNFAGSIGHMKINVNDTERCDCGGTGCFEMQIMPRRVFARVRELAARYPESAVGDPKVPLSIERLGAAADAGDELACLVIDEAVSWFAIAIHNLVLMFDPEKVVIQGTYARAGEHFIAMLRERAGQVSLVNIPHQALIECSTLDDDEAGTLGAASHVIINAFA